MILIERYLAITDTEEHKGKQRRKVTVRVKDWHGRLVIGAEVQIYENLKGDSKFLAKGYTDEDGELILAGLRKDSSYGLVVYYRGIKAERFIEAVSNIEEEKIPEKEEGKDILDEYYEDYGSIDQGDDEE